MKVMHNWHAGGGYICNALPTKGYVMHQRASTLEKWAVVHHLLGHKNLCIITI